MMMIFFSPTVTLNKKQNYTDTTKRRKKQYDPKLNKLQRDILFLEKPSRRKTVGDKKHQRLGELTAASSGVSATTTIRQ